MKHTGFKEIKVILCVYGWFEVRGIMGDHNGFEPSRYLLVDTMGHFSPTY